MVVCLALVFAESHQLWRRGQARAAEPGRRELVRDQVAGGGEQCAAVSRQGGCSRPALPGKRDQPKLSARGSEAGGGVWGAAAGTPVRTPHETRVVKTSSLLGACGAGTAAAPNALAYPEPVLSHI